VDTNVVAVNIKYFSNQKHTTLYFSHKSTLYHTI